MITENLFSVKTPCHIIDVEKIQKNIESLSYLRKHTNMKILFAVKGFSNEKIIPIFINEFDGISASGLWEARLGNEFFKMPVHTYSSAYKHNEFNSILRYSDYIIFNSNNQLETYVSMCEYSNKRIGLRINPEFSEVEKYAINPCHEFSRFGVTLANLAEANLNSITGIHFHSMCEQYSQSLEKTLRIVSDKFSHCLKRMRWINIGGGQLYTDENYNVENAITSINALQRNFDLEVFAEPCETVVSNVGYTIATVVDIVENGLNSAILDLSAICHLPDIVNSPYRCEVLNASIPLHKKYTYRLTGCTCYAGDIFGDYSFDTPLEIGSKIVFLDTAPYSMVKNNFFNGIKPPSCAIYKNGNVNIVKDYDYSTFLSIL